MGKGGTLMDHNKAYETLGSLVATISWVAREIELAEDQPHLIGTCLSSAKRELHKAQATYQQFRKDQGWDTQKRDGECYSCGKPVEMCDQVGCIDPRDDGVPEDDY